MATPGKLSKKERKKQIQTKTSLNSPYDLHWSPLPKADQRFIVKLLNDKLTAISLKKIEVKQPRSRPCRKGRDKKTPSGVGGSDNQVKQVLQEDTNVQGAPEKSSQNGWTNESARRQLAIGINEVTKALEKNELKLVLVCQSAQPPFMTSHLIALSRTRDVPAGQVPDLNHTVTEALGLKSVLALGFRRDDEQRKRKGTFSDTVDLIIPRLPSLKVPWIPDDDSTDNIPHPEDRDEARGQKRKIEVVSLEEDSGEPKRQKRKSESVSLEEDSGAPEGQKRKSERVSLEEDSGEPKGQKRKSEGVSLEEDSGEPEGQKRKSEGVFLEEDRDEARGQKRKIENASTDMIEPVLCALQPLRVKKIIPNPDKLRKPKTKK